tara:strand:- start:400 stop:588 length:189 start_codon:yes stop_codon:yes gene_type:complete
MSMSRKHYVMIAEVINGMSGKILLSKRGLVNKLSQVFEADNERFDDETFIKACNYSNTEEKL